MPTTPLVKRLIRRLRGQEPAAASERAQAPADPLVTMIERIRQSPLDPTLCYDLGVELLRKGIDSDGLRYLDRAFRLDPLNVVRFVKTPELKELRLRRPVIEFLSRLRRDEEQRSYGAYA